MSQDLHLDILVTDVAVRYVYLLAIEWVELKAAQDPGLSLLVDSIDPWPGRLLFLRGLCSRKYSICICQPVCV